MKHTKKLLAAVMAFAMVSAIAPMSAFADTEIKPDTVPPEGGLTVKYDVDPSYTVTIPAGVDITTGDKTASITLDEGALLAEGTKIEVVLEKGAYTTTGNAFTAKTASGNSSASYQINGGNVKVGDVVASLDKDTLSADLTFSRTTTIAPTYAGTHSEVLTFGIAVKEAAKYNVQVRATYNGDEVFEGEPNQIGLTGAMEPVTVRIPEDLKSICKFNRFDDVVQNGITKHWVDDYTVTVSGTPTADTNVFVGFDLIPG